MEIPRHWRLKAQRYRLEGSACPNCGQAIFPHRPMCPNCFVKPDQIVKRNIPVLLPSSTLSDVEAYIGERIMERLIV